MPDLLGAGFGMTARQDSDERLVTSDEQAKTGTHRLRTCVKRAAGGAEARRCETARAWSQVQRPAATQAKISPT